MKSYDNILIKGDLNSKISENCLNGFCNLTVSKLTNPTCIKNHSNHLRLDLFLTNWRQCFQQALAIETGIFDIHKKVVTVMKVLYKNQNPFSTNNHKYFHKHSFNFELNNDLLKIDISNAGLEVFNERIYF